MTLDLDALEVDAAICARHNVDEEEASEAVSRILVALPGAVARVRDLEAALETMAGAARQARTVLVRLKHGAEQEPFAAQSAIDAVGSALAALGKEPRREK